VQAKTGFRFRVETTNKKRVPGMGTQFVKKCLVSVNIFQEADLVAGVVSIDKRRNKTEKVLHRSAEVYVIVNCINPAHYQ
jgi:hypothetical protein